MGGDVYIYVPLVITIIFNAPNTIFPWLILSLVTFLHFWPLIGWDDSLILTSKISQWHNQNDTIKITTNHWPLTIDIRRVFQKRKIFVQNICACLAPGPQLDASDFNILRPF